MKRIRTRLFAYFSGLLLALSLVIALVFYALYSRYTLDQHKVELGERAKNIALTLQELRVVENSLSTQQGEGGQQGGGQRGSGQQSGQGMGSQGAGNQGSQGMGNQGTGNQGMGGQGMGRGMGYQSYMKFVEEIAGSEAWVFDPDHNQILRGNNQTKLTSDALPEGADVVMREALSGTVTYSENFGDFLGAPTLTVAAPILGTTGEAIAVVLLHERIGDIQAATQTGIWILLASMGGGILLSLILSNILAKRFTTPLEKMKTVAQQVSEGDYSVRTNVRQKDEIGALATSLDEMAQHLDAASKESAKLEEMRKTFIANISHELRTPVTVMRGSLEALCDGVVTDPEQVEGYYREMYAESVFLERLIADLLELSRLQNADFQIEKEIVDYRSISEDAVRAIGRVAQKKGVQIDLQASEGLYPVLGDYGRLRQMTMIVLDNAVKFSPAGERVLVRLQKTHTGATLSIEDHGSGIERDQLAHIFERFQKERSEKNKVGTGLGLAIAKQIANRHDIDISVESEPSVKTVFTFSVPLIPSMQE